MKAVILSQAHGAELAAVVREQPGVEVVLAENSAACARHLEDADFLWCQPSLADAALVAAVNGSSRLRWVQVLGSGIDAFAGLEERRRRSLILTNAAAAYGGAVAEHAMALALALLRRIPDMLAAQAGNYWSKDDLSQRVRSLDGMSVAIVGFGAIGQNLAARLRAFGCRITAVRRDAHAPAPPDFEDVAMAALPSALARAEILFLALPLTDESRNLIDARALAMLPPGAIVVNVSRGAVVVTDDLCAALRAGSLAAAALDVFEREPLPDRDPVWGAPNLRVSPHVGGRGHRSVLPQMIRICSDNLQAFLCGSLGASATKRANLDLPIVP